MNLDEKKSNPPKTPKSPESRRSTLPKVEQDEEDEYFAAAVWHCCSEKFIDYCGGR
jgi:hypothetical protein